MSQSLGLGFSSISVVTGVNRRACDSVAGAIAAIKSNVMNNAFRTIVYLLLSLGTRYS